MADIANFIEYFGDFFYSIIRPREFSEARLARSSSSGIKLALKFGLWAIGLLFIAGGLRLVVRAVLRFSYLF